MQTCTLKIISYHQLIDGLDRIREQARKRVAKYREKQKMLSVVKDNSKVNSKANVNSLEEEKEKEEDKNKNNKKRKKWIWYFVRKLYR